MMGDQTARVSGLLLIAATSTVRALSLYRKMELRGKRVLIFILDGQFNYLLTSDFLRSLYTSKQLFAACPLKVSDSIRT